MGHYYEVVTGRGANRTMAFYDACAKYFMRYGSEHRICNDYLGVRDPGPGDIHEPPECLQHTEIGSVGAWAEFMQRLPPIRAVERAVQIPLSTGRFYTVTAVEQAEDPTAPPSEWLEEWRFVLHINA